MSSPEAYLHLLQKTSTRPCRAFHHDYYGRNHDENRTLNMLNSFATILSKSFHNEDEDEDEEHYAVGFSHEAEHPPTLYISGSHGQVSVPIQEHAREVVRRLAEICACSAADSDGKSDYSESIAFRLFIYEYTFHRYKKIVLASNNLWTELKARRTDPQVPRQEPQERAMFQKLSEGVDQIQSAVDSQEMCSMSILYLHTAHLSALLKQDGMTDFVEKLHWRTKWTQGWNLKQYIHQLVQIHDSTNTLLRIALSRKSTTRSIFRSQPSLVFITSKSRHVQFHLEPLFTKYPGMRMRRTAEHEPFVPLDMPLVHDDPESFPHAESSLLAHFMTNNTAHLSSCIGVSNNRNCLGCTIYFEVFRRFRALARDGTKIDLEKIPFTACPEFFSVGIHKMNQTKRSLNCIENISIYPHCTRPVLPLQEVEEVMETYMRGILENELVGDLEASGLLCLL